jgi:microcin C transport system substrate-binding protein
LLDREKHVKTEAELVETSQAIQRLIHDEGIWVPGWTAEYARLGYWRWIGWPNSDTTKFCYPLVFEPTESYVFWVDEDVKKDTIHAKQTGAVYPEVDTVYDEFRFQQALPEIQNDPKAPRLPSVPVIVDESPTPVQPDQAQPAEQSPQQVTAESND